METLLGLFDSILTLVVTFPITIYNVVISPERLLDADGGAVLSSAGTTLFVSYLIWYKANSLNLKLWLEAKMPDAPSKTTSVQQILAIIVILYIQFLYLALAYFGSSSPAETIRIIKALSYPVSAFLTIYGLVYMVYMLFPIASSVNGLTLKERFDPNFRNARRDSGSKRIVIDEDASSIATMLALIAYVYSLYQVCRVFFGMLRQTAMLHTAGIILISVLLSALFAYLVFERFDKLVERLRSQQQSMPNDDR